jgi:hypothetical protein
LRLLPFAILLLAAGFPQGLQSQIVEGEGRPWVQAVRVPDEIEIRVDGWLNEEVWQLARPITDFRQQDPIEGADPSEPTEIRILYDDRALYIGAMLFDSNPSGILAHQLERNAGLGTDDRFMWILDTFRDGRTGYFFEINPAGLMGDGLIGGGGGGGGGGPNKRWNGIWDVRTRILPNGWSAEIRIPFSTLNFDPSRDAWGLNFQRTIRRKSEEIVWSGWRRNESLFRPASAGELRGLDGINQGVGLEVKPYALSSGDQAPLTGPAWQSEVKAGADITYSITPSLRAALTLNTDFAEVEVDQRRVNLTRFPLRFPEQREFFLEGSSVFSFNWADPFFSRRIGLVRGQEVPIQAGTRLGGQVGRYQVGVYQVRTGETVLEGMVPGQFWAAEDFTVGRVKRSLFQQSHVGAVYTRRASGLDADGWAPEDRHTYGGDFNVYSSRWLGRFNAQVEGFMVFHTDPEGDRSGFSPEHRARGLRLNFPNDKLSVHSSYRDFGTEWDPAVGFAQRRGFRRHQPTLTYSPRPERWSRVRQTEHQVSFEYLTDMDRRLLTRVVDLTFLQVNFESGDRFSLKAGHEFERLDTPFELNGGGGDVFLIPSGDYGSWKWSVDGQTAGRRLISGGGELRRADFWDGERTEFEVRATIRPRRGVSISSQYERNEVTLDEGAFHTNLVRLSGAFNLNPLVSFNSNVQYDDVTQVVGLFARGRWIVRPGNDVFVVWSHNWQSQMVGLLDREFETLSRGGAVKLNYTYRF